MEFNPPADWLFAQELRHASALPAPFYVEPQALVTEQRLVFARSWQLIAHAAALEGVGDHVIGLSGLVPIVVVRGEDGVLRAFHNVCRHRAGPLASADGRGARTLRCKYHGWSYGLDGCLRSAPDMREAVDFDPARVQLPEIAVDTWRGLVFVAQAGVPPLAEVFADVDARLGAHAPQDLLLHHRESFEVDCNWKVYVDNYLEGYHVPHLHPELTRLLEYRSYTTETASWSSLQQSPMKDRGNFYGQGEAAYFFVYPNTMLNLLPGRMQTNRVLPLGVQRCRVDFDYYYPSGTDAAELERRRDDQAFSAVVQKEDAEICAAVQQRLASGSYTAGRLCPKYENAVHHFHELLRRAWRES
jgi:choline monooxygenase